MYFLIFLLTKISGYIADFGMVINGQPTNELYRGIQMTEKNSGTLLSQCVKFPSFSKLDTDITSDILIVGGGITGITQLNKLLKLH